MKTILALVGKWLIDLILGWRRDTVAGQKREELGELKQKDAQRRADDAFIEKGAAARRDADRLNANPERLQDDDGFRRD